MELVKQSTHAIRAWLMRYGLTVLAVVAATALRYWLGKSFGLTAPYVTYYPVVILVAVLAGLGPGLAAMLLSGVAADYFLLAPQGSFAIASLGDRIGFALFMVNGAAISVLAGTMRRRNAELRRSKSDLDHAQAVAEVGSWHLDVAKDALTWSEETYRLFEVPIGTPVSREKVLERVPPEDRQKLMDGWDAALEGTASDVEHRLVVGGETRWVRSRTQVELDSGGKPRFATGTFQDITKRKRAEQSLMVSLATRESAIKELADQKFALDQHAIVAVTDVQGTITYVNEKFCAISQYSKDELIGQNHRIFNSGHHSKEFFQQMYHTIANGQVWHGEIKNRAKDGSMYWVESTIVPFAGADGKPQQYVAIRTDITECKRVEEMRGRLAAVVESSDDAIISKTLDGTVTAWNSGAEKLFGYSSAEALGKSLDRLLPPERANEESDILARIARGEHVNHFETVRVRKDGKRVDISATISPLKDSSGAIVGVANIARDITQRKAAEVEIRKLNEELERRVVERTAQLEAANQELEAFSYSVSHDLRAPLRHISGFSQLLVEEFGSTLDPTAQKYVERIRAGTQKMGLLVDGLLNLAGLGRHALRLQPTGLNAVIAEVLAILQPESEGRQVEWVIADLPAVECDPVLLRQIFQNLLANALKFTRPRAHAVIEVNHKEEEDGQVVFMVRDNGIGFNMKYVGKLFGVFQRLHRTEDFEGTGIGLATVQRIVHKHGGRVWAEAELDRGAAFYFTLGVGKRAESKSSGATAGGRL
jgi:PAS domain S-box-containing protein